MAEIKKEQVNVEDQQENEISETSFDDLPDDAIMQIMKGLDFASFLKLRLNKRLNRLQLAVKKELNIIDIAILSTGYAAYVENSNTHSSFTSCNFDQLSQGLHRLALNTRVDAISMTMHVAPNEGHCRVVDALLNFEASECRFSSSNCWVTDPWKLQHASLNSFNSITQNLGRFCCADITFSSLTAQDFCIIRKSMLESGCKLRFFEMKVEVKMEKYFFEACFGVTFDDFPGPLSGRIYHATDDSIEIYSYLPPISARGYNRFYHLEGDVSSTLWLSDSEPRMVFEKCEENEANEFAEHKVQLNYFYREQ